MRQNTPDRQEYVLNTALRLFLRHGFKKTSMDDIARAAGMTRQGLYFHYPSKDALARRAIERALEDGLEAVRRALTEEGGPEERLCRAMDAWFGGYVGLFTPQSVPDWEFHCRRLAGEEVDRAYARFAALLRETMAAPPGAPSPPPGRRPPPSCCASAGSTGSAPLPLTTSSCKRSAPPWSSASPPRGENKIP